VPPHELDLFHLTVEDVVEAGAAGKVEDGYGYLEGALYRAEDLEAEGEPWGHTLVERYRRALETYSELYGPTVP
jgi:hypothetical protein